MPLHVLLIDDKPYELESLAMLLGTDGHRVDTFEDARKAVEHLERTPCDVVVTDLNMPGMDGLELVNAVRDLYPDLPVLVVTGFSSIDSAVEAMKRGAANYLVKSPNLGDQLLEELSRLGEQIELRRHIAGEDDDSPEDRLGGLVGRSKAMREVFRLIRSVAAFDTTVLVRGETGTGKELIVGAIHALGARRNKPLVTVNCAALPEGLIESELFGHRKGAFTGATSDRPGKVEAAGEGTLVLDEVGDLPVPSQPKLLRLLEQKVYARVGSSTERTSSARVIAATNRDLESMVTEGTFRLDLLHRLNVVTVHIPPLRDRRGDIPLLADLLVHRVCARHGIPPRPISEAAMAALVGFSWPGNVRQLEHAVERAIVVGAGDAIEADDLPAEVRGAAPEPDTPLSGDSLKANERALVERVLIETGWNIHESSRRLGISRPTLYSKIKKHGLSRDG